MVTTTITMVSTTITLRIPVAWKRRAERVWLPIAMMYQIDWHLYHTNTMVLTTITNLSVGHWLLETLSLR